jgi:hypothetical protein
MAKLDTQDWRDQYDQMGKRWADLYAKRAPILKDYENKARQSLDTLIGESAPAIHDLYRQATGMGKYATDEYMPALSQYMSDAKGYDTPERRGQASQEAMVDVQQGAEASRQAAMQRLESFGIDPSMTRGAALDQNIRLQTALEQVKQGRDAATGVEERGQAYLRDALGLGAGIQQQGVQTAATAGGMANATTDAASRTAGTFANIYGSPVTNLEARKGMIDSSLKAKTTEAEFKAGQSEGSPIAGIAGSLGTMAGMAGGAYLGSAAGPWGAMEGAQIGGQMGGQLGGMVPGRNPSASRAAAGN